MVRIARSSIQIICADLHKKLIDHVIFMLHRLAWNCFIHSEYSYVAIAYKTILSLRHSDRSATMQLANLYELRSWFEPAIELYERWLERFPDDLNAHVAVSKVYAKMHEFGRANEHLQCALELGPDCAEVACALGFFQRWSGDLDKSIECLRASVTEGDSDIRFLVLLAQNLVDSGERSEGINLLERAIRVNPYATAPYALLAKWKYYRDASHPDLAFLERILARGSVPDLTRAEFHFALAHAYDNIRIWDRAFLHAKAANDISGRLANFNPINFTRRVSDLIDVFNRDVLLKRAVAPYGENGVSLVFIVGMPRSGTTLVEQILASHPDVYAGGERGDMLRLAWQLASDSQQPYPACLRGLGADAIEALARKHLANVSAVARGCPYFADKTPGHCYEIGLIHVLFPMAKIVHCVRDPLDTCLSCYFQNFEQCTYSHSLNHLALVYLQYQRIMSHWNSILQDRILNFRYEELVAKPEDQIRRLLLYCGLSWNSRCLAYHETKRTVQTASAEQVKWPINSQSIGRWKHYEGHLRPLIRALKSAGQPLGALP